MHKPPAGLSHKRFVWLTGFLLLFFTSRAQYNDAGLWLSFGLEKKVNQRLSATLTPQVRFNENIRELYKYFLDAGIAYKISKELKLGFNYRLINQRQLDNSFSTRHRFYIDLAWKHKLEKLSFTYRIRYQNQLNDIGISPDWQVPYTYVRNKMLFKYISGTRLQPYLGADLWYNVLPHTGKAIHNSQFDNVRITLGTTYELNKLSSFDLSYLINKAFNTRNPVTSYIIALGYNYSF